MAPSPQTHQYHPFYNVLAYVRPVTQGIVSLSSLPSPRSTVKAHSSITTPLQFRTHSRSIPCLNLFSPRNETNLTLGDLYFYPNGTVLYLVFELKAYQQTGGCETCSKYFNGSPDGVHSLFRAPGSYGMIFFCTISSVRQDYEVHLQLHRP